VEAKSGKFNLMSSCRDESDERVFCEMMVLPAILDEERVLLWLIRGSFGKLSEVSVIDEWNLCSDITSAQI